MTKKHVFVFLLSFLVIFSVSALCHYLNGRSVHTKTQQVANTSQGVIGLPVELNIPSLNVSAKVEMVGTDWEGRMGVPTEFSDVAWYGKGYKPGELGSAVISGHLDRINRERAVFYDLNALEKGDKVYITTSKNKKLEFEVVNKEVYKTDAFPLEKIFASYGVAGLNLITCDGEWQNGSYNERLVVYTRLVNKRG